MNGLLPALALALLLPLLAGCQRATEDMARQPRLDPTQTSPLFADGRADRLPVKGTVAVDGVGAPTARAASLPGPPPGSLARGRERYAIYCLPCHGARGDATARSSAAASRHRRR